MSLYIGKDKDGRAIIHATSNTQSVNTLKNGINANTIFHTDMPYFGFKKYPATIKPFTGSSAVMTDPSGYFIFESDAECRNLIASGHFAIPVYDFGNETYLDEGYCFAELEYPTAGVNLQGIGMMYSNTAGTAASLQPSAAFPCPIIYFKQPSHWEPQDTINNAYILVSDWSWKTETFASTTNPTSIRIEPSGIYFDGVKEGFIRIAGSTHTNNLHPRLGNGSQGLNARGVYIQNVAKDKSGVRIQRFSETLYQIAIGDEVLVSPNTPFRMSYPNKRGTITYPSTTYDPVLYSTGFSESQDTNVTWNKNDVFLFRVTCPTYGADYMVGPIRAFIAPATGVTTALFSVGKVWHQSFYNRNVRASLDLAIGFVGYDSAGSSGFIRIGIRQSADMGAGGEETVTLPATTVRMYNLTI